MDGKIIQLKDRLTGMPEYPVTAAESVLMPDGTRTLVDVLNNVENVGIEVDDALSLTSTNPVQNKVVAEAIANAGAIKDVQVDGTSVVVDGIANITIPETASLDLTTNKLTVGTTVLDKILTQNDLDDNIKDAANTAVTAATAHAVEELVGKLSDIDSNGDGTVDTTAPANIVAAINKVAQNTGSIDTVATTDGDLTITNKKVTIPDATTAVKGAVKLASSYSATNTTDVATGATIDEALFGLSNIMTLSDGQYVKSFSQESGKITNVQTGILPSVTGLATDGYYVASVSQDKGAVSATTKAFPEASTTVKGIINTTETYSATDITKAMTGKAVANMLDSLDVAETGEAGKYIQKIKQEDGKITATLAAVKDTYTATDLEPISGKGVAAALDTLDLAETGGTDKIITTIKQDNGLVTATAKTAVEKVATPATTNAYEYKIAEASVKVELPKATDTAYGEIQLDKLKIDSASTAKTDNPKLMTGKAIEDSLAVKKVNGNSSIYAHNSTVPAVDNAIAFGSSATVVAADSVAIGKEAYTGSANSIALGINTTANNVGEIAIGRYNKSITDSDVKIGTAFTVGNGSTSEAKNLLEQKINGDLYIPGIGNYDGKNSDPTDYETDDDGNTIMDPYTNLPVKKVRTLQDTINFLEKRVKWLEDILERITVVDPNAQP